MLEFMITFAVILFAGVSVTLGILRARRTPGHGCHCKPMVDSQTAAKQCGSCQIIDARHN